MTFKRNLDNELPASHVFEFAFSFPENFSGEKVAEVNRVVFKETENDRGTTLIGAPAQFSENTFIFALNDFDEALKKNLNFIEDNEWIDVPVRYATGKRALITFEKGEGGKKLFKDATEAWASSKS